MERRPNDILPLRAILYRMRLARSWSTVEDLLEREIRIPCLINMVLNIVSRIKIWSRVKNIYKIFKNIFIWMLGRTYVNKRSFINIYFIVVS